MPWTSPTLDELRALNRDNIAARLDPSRRAPLIPNSLARILADANAGLGHLNLKYLEWLARQLLIDTAEADWLKRHADLWLPGGVKTGRFAAGYVLATGAVGAQVPAGTPLVANVGGQIVQFETAAQRTIGDGDTGIPVIASTPGRVGNLEPGSLLSFATAISGVDGSAAVFDLSGGADAESEDDLRQRLLFRIQNPPQGGAAHDYVAWALEVPGVSRAWASPLEQGIGTMTVRFMTDRLADGVTYFRAGVHHAGLDPLMAFNGFPSGTEIMAVADHINEKRPVTVRDFFVAAPVPEPISFAIAGLDDDSASTRANIAESVRRMLYQRAKPAWSLNGIGQEAQTIYREWVSEAITHAAGVNRFTLVMDNHEMPFPGAMAVLGTITYT